MGAIGCVLSNADSANTPRTSLETTQRTNRTFFIMMLPFAGHENIGVFFFMDTTWRVGAVVVVVGGSKKNHIRYMELTKKNAFVWLPWHSTNGMPVEKGSRADRITMWKKIN